MWAKITAVLGTIVAGLLLYISTQKNRVLKNKVSEVEAVAEYTDKANKALIKGVENENKKSNTRGYFSD